MSKFMSKKEKREKQRHQVKSRWYYLFWGAATVSVFAGQMYVGTGYRRMSKAIESVLESPIVIEQKRHHMMIPFEPEHHPMVIQ